MYNLTYVCALAGALRYAAMTVITVTPYQPQLLPDQLTELLRIDAWSMDACKYCQLGHCLAL